MIEIHSHTDRYTPTHVRETEEDSLAATTWRAEANVIYGRDEEGKRGVFENLVLTRRLLEHVLWQTRNLLLCRHRT